MNEIISNWTKICVGVCMILLTVGYITGHVSANDLVGLVAAAGGVHAVVSGVTGMKS